MLKFNSNGRFGILLFGDLHEYFDYADSAKFKDMQKLMNAALDMYRPDLCVLLGDTFNTANCKDDPEGFKRGVKDICAPILSRNIPVCAIMGNHEHDAGCDAEVIKAYGEIENMTMSPARRTIRSLSIRTTVKSLSPACGFSIQTISATTPIYPSMTGCMRIR